MTDTFQWRRCDASDPGDGSTCVDIPGETASTYLLAAADVGHRMQVTAARDAVPTTPSALTGVVSAPGTATWVGVMNNPLSTVVFPHQSYVPGHASVVLDPLGSGKNVLRLAVNDSDRPYVGATNPRADFESPFLFFPGNEVYILVQPLIPLAVPLVPDVGGDFFQWCEPYGPPFGGSPPFGPDIRAHSGVNHFGAGRGARYGYDRIWLGPPVDGAWHTVVIHERFATDSTGFIEIIFDDVLQTLTNGSTRAYMVTLDPGVNWDGHSGNFININQYRKAGMIPGTVTTYHGPPAVGPTYASVIAYAI